MTEWLSSAMEQMSYSGVALLMMLENVFPPIPSEVIMPAAGFAAKQGEISFVGVVLAGTAGSLLGVTPWYFLARWWGADRLKSWAGRYGRWLAIRPHEVDRAVKWFDRWGKAAVLFGRLIPGIRTLISVPAGFAAMPFWQFITFSACGTLAWTLLLAWLGWYLEQHRTLVERYSGYIATAVLAGVALWWLVRLARHHAWLGDRTAGKAT